MIDEVFVLGWDVRWEFGIKINLGGIEFKEGYGEDEIFLFKWRWDWI